MWLPEKSLKNLMFLFPIAFAFYNKNVFYHTIIYIRCVNCNNVGYNKICISKCCCIWISIFKVLCPRRAKSMRLFLTKEDNDFWYFQTVFSSYSLQTKHVFLVVLMRYKCSEMHFSWNHQNWRTPHGNRA